MSGDLGGAILGGVFDLAGAAIEENAAKEMARKSRDFQAKMRNTQYQAAVKDMRAAGLNPILATRFGGSGVPSGAMAKPGRWSGIGSRAAATYNTAKVANAQAGALKASGRNQNSQAALNELKAAEQGVRSKIWSSAKDALEWIENKIPENLDSEVYKYMQRTFQNSAKGAKGLEQGPPPSATKQEKNDFMYQGF